MSVTVKEGDRVWLRNGNETKVVTVANKYPTAMCFREASGTSIHLAGICSVEDVINKNHGELWTIEEVEGAFDAKN